MHDMHDLDHGNGETMNTSRPGAILGWITCLALLAACTGKPEPASSSSREKSATPFQITSTAFTEGAAIPRRYTGQGDDISPPLAWNHAPAGTRSFALVCDDPDAPAGTWVHWVVYNIPADTTSLPEAFSAGKKIPSGAVQGTNSWQRLGYGGPMPPSGTHRYFFKIYALDTVLQLEPGQTQKALLEAMEGHVLWPRHS
jgi:Raf kinase inhibitor-like YbhB/YbcL family protein